MVMKNLKRMALAAALGLVISVQGVMPVSAAARSWVHSNCGTQVVVSSWTEVKNSYESPCTVSGHVPSCRVVTETCVDHYMVTCPSCNITLEQNVGNTYTRSRHVSVE